MSFVVPFHWVSPKTQIEAKQATPTLTRQNLEDQGKNKGLSTECENEMDQQLPALYVLNEGGIKRWEELQTRTAQKLYSRNESVLETRVWAIGQHLFKVL